MTHDELLAQIDLLAQPSAGSSNNKPSFYKALRAIVELHKPKSSHPDGWHEEIHCAQGDDQFHYPCPTIQAIENELK
jgi:hypothetical protein